jgi:plastocyanin
MKLNLYHIGILATTFLFLSVQASFATPTNQTGLTDEIDQADTTPDDFADDFGFVSIGQGSNLTVQYFTFTPQSVEIDAGETVTWFSPDEITDIHTVTILPDPTDPSIQSDILLPFAIPAGSSATDFELLPPFSLGEPVTILGPQGREAIVAMNKVAWYPSVVDTNNQTTYLEGADIQATLNSTVKVLNSGIIVPSMPSMDAGQMNNTETGTAPEPSETPVVSPTSLTTETTNATGSPTDALTIPDDEGTPQDPQGATEEPLGPPFPPVSSFTVVFEEPGVYPYFCAIHPWMVGQVIVRGDAQTETGITQPSANETATTTVNQTAPETEPTTNETTEEDAIPDNIPAETITEPTTNETITQPSANETATTTVNQTAPETQDIPLSEPDAETQTPPPPTTGTESPNPIFG